MNNKISYFISRIGFFFPILMVPLVVYLKYDEFMYPGDLILNILLVAIIILSCNLINSSTLKKYLEILLMVFFNVFVFIKVVHIYLFRGFFSRESVYHLMQTNKSEAGSFMTMYMDSNLLLIAVSLIIGVIFSSYLIMIQKKTGERGAFWTESILFDNHKTHKFFIFIFLALFVTYITTAEHRRYYFLPYTIVNGYYHYQKDLDEFKKLGHDKLGGNFSNVQHDGNTDSEIVVLVLGESTTRHHMSLYGYYRDTNPKLGKIKNDIIAYNDVISPNATSIPSISKILTLGDHKDPKKKFDGSIIQLFNRAGFKTYWISVQQESGVYDSFITYISNSSSEQIFVSKYDYVPLDQELISPFKKVLLDNDNKKLIVLHMLGTHANYVNRYPENFDFFKDEPDIKFKNKEAFDNTNRYDNAVLYNDYVVNNIISEVKKMNKKASVIYVSDHGEEVFETLDISGHWDDIVTKPMHDVPFIIWLSDKDLYENLVFDVNRKYILEDLIYTIADLASISFNEFDSTKSVVNSGFKYKRRVIGKDEDYDELFGENKK